MKCPKQENSQKQKVDYWFLGVGGEGDWGVCVNGYGVSFRSDEMY